MAGIDILRFKRYSIETGKMEMVGFLLDSEYIENNTPGWRRIINKEKTRYQCVCWTFKKKKKNTKSSKCFESKRTYIWLTVNDK